MAAISPAPAEPLGPLTDADFSDPEVRKKAYAMMGHAIGKTTGDAGMFSHCCGSAIFDAGGKRLFPYPPSKYPNPAEPAYAVEPNDGTMETVMEQTNNRYNQEWFNWYHLHYGHYYELDPRAYNGYSAERQKEFAESAKRGIAKRYVVRDRHRLIFSWDLTSEEAINKWFTSEEYRSKAKGLDFEDAHDGKACLIWTDQ